MGEGQSELRLLTPGTIHATVRVAAHLEKKPNPEVGKRRYSDGPYWDIERARIGETRNVPVELVVNGHPVARQEILADGEIRDVSFDVPVEKSSWVAVRILGSSHTNPIFVLVGGKPIRASTKSAQWCLDGVEKCWTEKQRFIKADEMADAKAAYEHARVVYRQLISECQTDESGAKPSTK
jgi:hypothetical protein